MLWTMVYLRTKFYSHLSEHTIVFECDTTIKIIIFVRQNNAIDSELRNPYLLISYYCYSTEKMYYFQQYEYYMLHILLY